jgi:hypothetical protein
MEKEKQMATCGACGFKSSDSEFLAHSCREENAKLRAEVERLQKENLIAWNNWGKENEVLKLQVGELQKNQYAAAIEFLKVEAKKIPLGEGSVQKGFSSTYNCLMFAVKSLEDDCVLKPKSARCQDRWAQIQCTLEAGHGGKHSDGCGK